MNQFNSFSSDSNRASRANSNILDQNNRDVPKKFLDKLDHEALESKNRSIEAPPIYNSMIHNSNNLVTSIISENNLLQNYSHSPEYFLSKKLDSNSHFSSNEVQNAMNVNDLNSHKNISQGKISSSNFGIKKTSLENNSKYSTWLSQQSSHYNSGNVSLSTIGAPTHNIEKKVNYSIPNNTLNDHNFQIQNYHNSNFIHHPSYSSNYYSPQSSYNSNYIPSEKFELYPFSLEANQTVLRSNASRKIPHLEKNRQFDNYNQAQSEFVIESQLVAKSHNSHKNEFIKSSNTNSVENSTPYFKPNNILLNENSSKSTYSSYSQPSINYSIEKIQPQDTYSINERENRFQNYQMNKIINHPTQSSNELRVSENLTNYEIKDGLQNSASNFNSKNFYPPVTGDIYRRRASVTNLLNPQEYISKLPNAIITESSQDINSRKYNIIENTKGDESINDNNTVTKDHGAIKKLTRNVAKKIVEQTSSESNSSSSLPEEDNQDTSLEHSSSQSDLESEYQGNEHKRTRSSKYSYQDQKHKARKRKRSYLEKKLANVKECFVCHATETPLWRYADNKKLCNRCGIYYNRNGSHRPVNLKKRRKLEIETSYSENIIEEALPSPNQIEKSSSHASEFQEKSSSSSNVSRSSKSFSSENHSISVSPQSFMSFSSPLEGDNHHNYHYNRVHSYSQGSIPIIQNKKIEENQIIVDNRTGRSEILQESNNLSISTNHHPNVNYSNQPQFLPHTLRNEIHLDQNNWSNISNKEIYHLENNSHSDMYQSGKLISDQKNSFDNINNEYSYNHVNNSLTLPQNSFSSKNYYPTVNSSSQFSKSEDQFNFTITHKIPSFDELTETLRKRRNNKSNLNP